MPYNPDGSFTLAQNFGTGTAPDSLLPPKIGSALEDLAASIAITGTNNPFLQKALNLSDIPNDATARSNIGAPGTSQTDFLSGGIKIPANQTYYLIINIPFGVTITSFTGYCQAGTLTAKLTIDNADVTGSSINVSNAGYATASISSGNVMNVADFLGMVVSSVSGSTDFSFTVEYTRVLV